MGRPHSLSAASPRGCVESFHGRHHQWFVVHGLDVLPSSLFVFSLSTFTAGPPELSILNSLLGFRGSLFLKSQK